MTTITIPKNLIREKDLILIPRRDYERLLDLKEKVKKTKILDRDLEKSLKEAKSRRTSGPFKTISGLIKSLEK